MTGSISPEPGMGLVISMLEEGSASLAPAIKGMPRPIYAPALALAAITCLRVTFMFFPMAT
jgi:hypothetical protein